MWSFDVLSSLVQLTAQLNIRGWLMRWMIAKYYHRSQTVRAKNSLQDAPHLAVSLPAKHRGSMRSQYTVL